MEETRKPFWKRCETTPRDRRNQRRIIVWAFGWIATWVAANFAITREYMTSATAVTAAAVLSTILGVLTVLAYRRFLREADELRRKIEVEALALSVGVGLVGGFTYFLLEQAGIATESGVAVMIILISFTHALGVVLGQRRYA